MAQVYIPPPFLQPIGALASLVAVSLPPHHSIFEVFTFELNNADWNRLCGVSHVLWLHLVTKDLKVVHALNTVSADRVA